MKKLLSIILVATLTGCLGDPQSTEHVGKDKQFEVDYLFEKDGVKVYRFIDGGRFHYFTTNGETITTQNSGKSTYNENIKPENW